MLQAALADTFALGVFFAVTGRVEVAGISELRESRGLGLVEVFTFGARTSGGESASAVPFMRSDSQLFRFRSSSRSSRSRSLASCSSGTNVRDSKRWQGLDAIQRGVGMQVLDWSCSPAVEHLCVECLSGRLSEATVW